MFFCTHHAFQFHNSIRHCFGMFWSSVCACSDIFRHFGSYYYSNSIDGTCPASATDMTFVKPRRVWPVLTCIMIYGLKHLLKLENSQMSNIFLCTAVCFWRFLKYVYVRYTLGKLKLTSWTSFRSLDIFIKLTYVWDHLSYRQASVFFYWHAHRHTSWRFHATLTDLCTAVYNKIV